MDMKNLNDENSNLIVFADFSTATYTNVYIVTSTDPHAKETDTHKDKRIVNLQLKSWRDAKEIFRKILVRKDQETRIEELGTIVTHCVNSLTQLIGRNVKASDKGRVPSLMESVNKSFPTEKKWNLLEDNPELHRELNKLNSLCEVLRHFGNVEAREEMVRNLSLEKVRNYLKVTQELWKWILDKHFKGNIPEDQIREFQENFDI